MGSSSSSCRGAASQCDTFDYKPELVRRHGEKFDPGGKVELFQSSPGAVMKSPWAWKQHGESGRWVSDLLPHLAGRVDDMAFLYSMVSKSNVHGPATFLQATGFVAPGFPAMGAWVTYGLGSLNENLPAFVVLPDHARVRPQRPRQLGSAGVPAGLDAGGRSVRPGSKTPIYDLSLPKRCLPDPRGRPRGLPPFSVLDSDEPRPPQGPRGRHPARRPDQLVRVSRPAPAQRPGGARPGEGIGRDQGPVRPG